jgi:hypothetical protein
LETNRRPLKFCGRAGGEAKSGLVARGARGRAAERVESGRAARRGNLRSVGRRADMARS